MRILHLSPRLSLHDGPSNVIFTLLKEFRIRGVDNVVASLRPALAGRNPQKQVEALGARYVDIGMAEGFVDLSVIRPLIRLIRSENIDVVQCNMLRANLYGRLAASLVCKIPVVCVAHGIEDYMLSETLASSTVKAVERWTAGWASAYVAVSQSTADMLSNDIGIKSCRISVIPNGLEDRKSIPGRQEARQQLNLPQDAFVVGTVARLHPPKGLADLLQAADRLRKRVADLRVVIVGDGPDRKRLEGLCDQLSLHDVVIMKGARPDVADILPAFDAFVMTSYAEGLPLSLLEAMRSELPSVVTDAGGMPEAVIDGETGFVIKAGDYESLVSRLERIAADSDLRVRLGKSGRKRFLAQFTSAEMAESYLRLYRTL